MSISMFALGYFSLSLSLGCADYGFCFCVLPLAYSRTNMIATCLYVRGKHERYFPAD